jgi:hypothetical protein
MRDRCVFTIRSRPTLCPPALILLCMYKYYQNSSTYIGNSLVPWVYVRYMLKFLYEYTEPTDQDLGEGGEDVV